MKGSTATQKSVESQQGNWLDVTHPCQLTAIFSVKSWATDWQVPFVSWCSPNTTETGRLCSYCLLCLSFKNMEVERKKAEENRTGSLLGL